MQRIVGGDAGRRIDILAVEGAGEGNSRVDVGHGHSLGCNLLTLAPRQCVAVAGNPVTRGRLESEGVEVHVLRGEEICLKGLGGPTCLTRPLDRG